MSLLHDTRDMSVINTVMHLLRWYPKKIFWLITYGREQLWHNVDLIYHIHIWSGFVNILISHTGIIADTSMRPWAYNVRKISMYCLGFWYPEMRCIFGLGFWPWIERNKSEQRGKYDWSATDITKTNRNRRDWNQFSVRQWNNNCLQRQHCDYLPKISAVK